MKDIFGDESFERLHETIEDGKQEVFEFHLPIGKVRHSFIKREISVQIGGEAYYDISTPCSYGGPVIFDCHEDDKWELVDEFQRAFQAYCEENKIISEYVRFHPLLSNVLDFTCLYEVECIGKTAGINLAFSQQSFANNFIRFEDVLVSKPLMWNIGYSISIDVRAMNEFENFYFSSEKIKNENEFHSYKKQYLSDFLMLFSNQFEVLEATYGGTGFAMNLNSINANTHYSNFNLIFPEYEYMVPNQLMKIGLAEWEEKNGIELIHFDGVMYGIEEGESTYDKIKNNERILDFNICVGKKVWNEEIYKEICRVVQIGADANFFPAYRFKEQYKNKDKNFI